jgi:hypothetical protein
MLLKHQEKDGVARAKLLSDYGSQKDTQDALSDDQKLVQLQTEHRLYGHDGKL